MNANLLKRLDALAGPVLARLLGGAGKRAFASPPASALVIRPGGIGDAVLLIPALAALKGAYPSLSIDVLAEGRNAAAFGLTTSVRRVLRYDSVAGLATALAGGYDLVIDTEQWYRLSAVVARLTRAPLRIGYAGNERRELFSHPMEYPLDSYEALAFFSLLGPLHIAVPAAVAAPFLELPADAVAEAERLLAPLSGRPFLTLFPGASTPEKQWGTEKFSELVARLGRGGDAVVVVGGGDTRGSGRELARCGAFDVTGRSSLAVTAAVIARGRALVTGDSGLLHIAAGLGTPTVSLFGPSDPRKWAPPGEPHRYLAAGLRCAPCSRYGTTPPCAQGTRCISEIGVEGVAAALEDLLGPERGRGVEGAAGVLPG